MSLNKSVKPRRRVRDKVFKNLIRKELKKEIETQTLKAIIKSWRDREL